MDETDETPGNRVVDFGPELARMKEMRGEVVEGFAQIENVIDFVIAAHYARDPFHFHSEVTANEHFSWALRRSLFENVARAWSMYNEKEDQNLRRLASLRNLFAHASKRISGVTADWKPKTYFNSPKIPGGRFEPEKAFREFEVSQRAAWAYVQSLQTAVIAAVFSSAGLKAKE